MNGNLYYRPLKRVYRNAWMVPRVDTKSIKLISTSIVSLSGSVQFWPLFSFDFCLLSPFFYFFRHVSFFLTCLLFMTRLVLFCVLLLLFNMLKPITTSIISKQKS